MFLRLTARASCLVICMPTFPFLKTSGLPAKTPVASSNEASRALLSDTLRLFVSVEKKKPKPAGRIGSQLVWVLARPGSPPAFGISYVILLSKRNRHMEQTKCLLVLFQIFAGEWINQLFPESIALVAIRDRRMAPAFVRLTANRSRAWLDPAHAELPSYPSRPERAESV